MNNPYGEPHRLDVLAFNDYTQGVHRARREYAEHPSTSCEAAGCFELVRDTPRCSEHTEAPAAARLRMRAVRKRGAAA